MLRIGMEFFPMHERATYKNQRISERGTVLKAHSHQYQHVLIGLPADELRKLDEGKPGEDVYWRQYTYQRGKYTLEPLSLLFTSLSSP